MARILNRSLQIKVSFIVVPKQFGSFLPFYDELAYLSGGKAHVVREETVLRKYLKIMRSLEDICDSCSNAMMIDQSFDLVTKSHSESSGTFFVDNSLGGKTEFMLLVEDAEEHLVKSVYLENTGAGLVYGPYTHVASTYDSINMKTINYLLGAGEWSYRVEWHTPPVLEREVGVVVLAQPEIEYLISMWTDSDMVVDMIDTPCVLYVSVMRGGYPVLRASVQVYIQILTDQAEVINIGPIDLFDNGNGDPDIVGDDGVYSRYLLEYPSVGRYSFSIHVTGVKNKTCVLMEGESFSDASELNKVTTCCGSHTNIEKYKLVSIDPFKRVKLGLARNFIQVPDSLSQDRMAPSKIQDLRIKILVESSSLLATWTAPGNNSDSGSVSGYRFVFSEDIGKLLDQEVQGDTLLMLCREDMVGTKTRYQFQFKYFDKSFYIGVVGIDSANNTGKMSNLVRVFMPATAPVNTTVTDGSKESLQQDIPDQWKMIAALCGSLLLLAVSLFLAILYFLHCKSKNISTSSTHDEATDNISYNTGERKTRNYSTNARNTSNCSSDLGHTSNYSTDAKDTRNYKTVTVTNYSPNIWNTNRHNLMPDVTQVFPAPPALLSDNTPSYWSATQLLTQHEQRALALSYGAWQGGVKEIESDEYEGVTNQDTPENSDDDMTSSDLAPEMFSLGVQTTAPSTTAMTRHSIYRTRSVSLV